MTGVSWHPDLDLADDPPSSDFPLGIPRPKGYSFAEQLENHRDIALARMRLERVLPPLTAPQVVLGAYFDGNLRDEHLARCTAPERVTLWGMKYRGLRKAIEDFEDRAAPRGHRDHAELHPGGAAPSTGEGS